MLSARARDWVYFAFLAVHLPATLLVDVFAAKDDPLLTNANAPLFAWFQAFIILEILFQVPVFFAGMRGLWKHNPAIYPLLAVYGASSATTTFACLATVLTMPGIPQPHLVKLLASYVPFLLVPLAMAVDYTLRLTRLAQGGRPIKDKRA
ncbi:hypothetical protein JCM10213v2_003758 [Rhodosporidiobolus nylandii]